MTNLDTKSQNYLNVLSLELAAKCNLKCIMCSHPQGKSRTGIMSLENFKIILEKIAHTKINSISLNMGEPFMNKAIFEMITYAKTKGYHVYISTNGQLVTEEFSRKIVDTGVDFIKFSAEGYTREVYEGIRVGGSFKRLQLNIDGLKRERDKRNIIYFE